MINLENSRFLRQPGPLLSGVEISNFEQEFGHLPSNYSAFLRRENGGVGQSSDAQMDGFLFYGIGSGSSSLEDEWREIGVSGPTKILPVGESLNTERLFVERQSGEVWLDGESERVSLEEFLSKNFDRIGVVKSLVGMIANECIDELERMILSGEIDESSVLEKGMSLPQFAAFLGKERVLKLLHEHGFGLSGAMHSALIGPGVSRPLIALLIDCGVGLDGVDAQGRMLCDLSSAWHDDVRMLAAERSGLK